MTDVVLVLNAGSSSIKPRCSRWMPGYRVVHDMDRNHRVGFGTSGHWGSRPAGAFTEAHIAAIIQAICDHDRAMGSSG